MRWRTRQALLRFAPIWSAPSVGQQRRRVRARAGGVASGAGSASGAAGAAAEIEATAPQMAKIRSVATCGARIKRMKVLESRC